jgi:hypothetical protein
MVHVQINNIHINFSSKIRFPLTWCINLLTNDNTMILPTKSNDLIFFYLLIIN